MTSIHKLEAVVILGLLLLAVAFRVGWERDQHRLDVAQAVDTQKSKQIELLSQAIVMRDGQANAYAAQIDQQELTLRTPQQATTVIRQYLKADAPAGSAAAVQLTVAPVTFEPADLTPAQRNLLPDSPSYTTFTEAQTIQLGKDELACDATRHQLTACTADVKDLTSSLADETTVANTWKAAAKGGSKWQRFGHAAKLVGCAAAGAGAVSFLKPSPQSAAIGGAGAVALCSAF